MSDEDRVAALRRDGEQSEYNDADCTIRTFQLGNSTFDGSVLLRDAALLALIK